MTKSNIKYPQYTKEEVKMLMAKCKIISKMTAKRSKIFKTRYRPVDVDGESFVLVDYDERLFYASTIFNIKDAKRLIKFLQSAVKYLEQNNGEK